MQKKQQQGYNNLFLLEYNRETKQERIITNYSFVDPTFVQHVFSFSDAILILLENRESKIWLIQVDKRTGEEIARLKVTCLGKFYDCVALTENAVLVYTCQSERFAGLFKEYQRVTGSNRIVYLYNIRSKKYFIKNKKYVI